MNLKVNKWLEYLKKGRNIFYEIYLKWIHLKIMLFFLFFILINIYWERLESIFVFLLFWAFIMFFNSSNDKINNWYNFIRSLFIFWWLGLFFMHIDFDKNSFHEPIIWMTITIIFFLLMIPISSYILKKYNKLKYLPHLILFYLFLWALISEFI